MVNGVPEYMKSDPTSNLFGVTLTKVPNSDKSL